MDVLDVLLIELSALYVVEFVTFVVFVTVLPDVVKLLVVFVTVRVPSEFVTVVTGPATDAGPVITGVGMSMVPPCPRTSPMTRGSKDRGVM